MSEKFGFKDRAIVVESGEGVLLKPFPVPKKRAR